MLRYSIALSRLSVFSSSIPSAALHLRQRTPRTKPVWWEWSIDGADRATNVSGRDGPLAAVLRRARRLPLYDRLKRVVPADARHAVAFRVEERSVRPYADGDMPSTDLPGPLQDELVTLYLSDARLLAGLGLAVPPWTDRWVRDPEGRPS